MEKETVIDLLEAGIQGFKDKYCKRCEKCTVENNCKIYKLTCGELSFLGLEYLIGDDYDF